MPKHEQVKIIENKLEEVEDKIEHLVAIKGYLVFKLSKLK